MAAPDGKVLPAPVHVERPRSGRRIFRRCKFIAAQTAARGVALPTRHLDACLPVDRQPQCVSPHRGADAGDACGLLPRCAGDDSEALPGDQGLTMRVHGESGIPEGSYEFWKTLFEAVTGCGRTVEIDMHAKGVDEKMIDIAVATGMPVKLGAKYSAEHQSLGYQQADIRALEIPKPGHAGEGPFSLSSGVALVYALRLRGFFEDWQPVQAAVPLVAGNAAAFAHRRSGDGGGVRANGAFLRRGGTGFDGATDVQGQGRLGAAGRAMRVCRCDAQSEVRLAEVRTLLSRVGPPALRLGCESGGVAALDASEFGARRVGRWRRPWRRPAGCFRW